MFRSFHNYRHTPCCVCSAKLKENSNGTSTTQFLLTSNKEFVIHPQQLSITEARRLCINSNIIPPKPEFTWVHTGVICKCVLALHLTSFKAIRNTLLYRDYTGWGCRLINSNLFWICSEPNSKQGHLVDAVPVALCLQLRILCKYPPSVRRLDDTGV